MKELKGKSMSPPFQVFLRIIEYVEILVFLLFLYIILKLISDIFERSQLLTHNNYIISSYYGIYNLQNSFIITNVYRIKSLLYIIIL